MLILIKKLLKKSTRLLVFRKVGFPRCFLNFIFQRVFRKNSKFKTQINFTSTVIFPELISFHRDVTTLTSFAVSEGCYFQAINGIKVGRRFLFAPGVKLISSNHNPVERDVAVNSHPIEIGDDVWIGANAIILPGVKIGNNCIIGAGAVVTKSFLAEGLIIAGNPAKVIGSISGA